MSFNFMAEVTICSDFGDPPKMSDIVSTVSPSICHEVMGSDAVISQIGESLANGQYYVIPNTNR